MNELMEIKNKVHTAIYGCGNILFGDDGVGPVVANTLKEMDLGEDILIEDVGTSVRDILFDYLLAPELGPRRIIIIDAVDFPDRSPGEVFEIHPRSVPLKKSHDFSLHQFPTVNMLAELAEATDIEVRVIAIQVESIPDVVRPGLSKPVAKAVKNACKRILNILKQGKTSEVREDDVRIQGQ